ncbi:TlpA family protein disulfide reductase [Chitinophaga hostae]|uniref:Redoxin domain-containing protein n=1 Tax=Chitinophaga hostae TaxID=2831022 RepID=A0ABS5IVZ4_9BACT|nr:TlpA family protein disulfide reductase [Chitinophaga hostae]MBS0027091.1 redoxin domain-containing protein [Chitinophaga hostae]
MKFMFFFALALIGLARPSFAQDLQPAKLHRLSVGDTVPDIFFLLWNEKAPIKLSDHTGKLVILDFWATWCSSCVRMFPKYDSLENQFSGQIKFLLVNSVRGTLDSIPQLQTFFRRWQTVKGKPFPLTTAINDTTAFKLFPHIYIPHYVWISANRKILGITSAEALTTGNIQEALKGQILKEPIKDDRYDRDN